MYGTLTKDEIENILQSQIVGRLGCSDKNIPYVVPISYVYDGVNIFCQSQDGKKIHILRNNPNICLQVDIVNNANNWKSVVINGKFQELTELESKIARELLYSHVFTLMTDSAIHRFEHQTNSNVIEDVNKVKNILFKIDIDEISGRFEKL